MRAHTQTHTRARALCTFITSMTWHKLLCFLQPPRSKHLIYSCILQSPYFHQLNGACTVLYCTVLYCTVLYCTVLYCTVLYHTVLYCTVLYCTVPYCTVLYCTVPYLRTRNFYSPQTKTRMGSSIRGNRCSYLKPTSFNLIP